MCQIKVSLILFLVVFSFSISAQEITVLDLNSKNPIDNVTLHSINPKVNTLTNIDGKANIDAFKNSNKIHIRTMGYESRILSYNYLKNVNFIVHLIPENTSLNEVILSATKWKETKKRLPNSFVTIKSKDIALANSQTTADVLSSTGKIFMQKSQLGGGSPIIRGFATNRVLINVDGVRMNNAIFRSGNVQNIISIDANSIHSTEVILGPGTVIYGSDAIGGVMNFYSLEPVFSESKHGTYSGNALSRWSSANNEKTIHFDLNISKQKWSFITSATFSDFEDLKMGKNGPKDYLRLDYVVTNENIDKIVLNKNPRKQVETGYYQNNFLQKIMFKPNSYLDFTYAFHYSTTSNYNRYDQLIRRKSNGELKFAEWYYGPQEWNLHLLKINYTKPTLFFDKSQFTTSYQTFQESRHSRNLNSITKINNIENVDAISVNFDFIKKLSETQKFSYGIEYVINTVGSVGFKNNIITREITPSQSRYPDGSNWQSLANYLQYENKLTDKITFQSGFRFNQIWINATFDNQFINYPFTETEINTSAFTGSAGFSYLPNNRTALFFNASTAFRSPNIDDIGKIFESTPGNVVVPNPNLTFEYAYNTEVGIERKIGNYFTINATAFYTLLKDALVKRDYTFNGSSTILFLDEISNVQAIQNAAKAYVYGFQTSFDAELLPTLHWKTNLNWNKGKEELDNGDTAALRHAAPFFGDSKLVLKTRKWILDFNIIYNGEIKSKDLSPLENEKAYLYALDSNGKPFAPDWYTLNIKAIYTVNSNWSVSGGIENLTDKLYRPYSSGIASPARNFIIAVKTSF